MNIGWIIFVAVYVLVDVYTFQAVKTVTSNRWIHIGFFLISLAVLIAFIVSITGMGDSRNMTPFRMYSFGSFIALFMPKLLLIIVILFGEDLYRIVMGLYAKFFSAEQTFYMPERRRFISMMALGLAALPFGSLLYGMFKGRYNYKVLSYEVTFDDLPDAFDGYTITQISDIHSGSFTNANKVNYAVDLVNKQQSDLILFTGDLVNDLASEMAPWKDVFASLKASDGVYSVLGNHDYGDYFNWSDEALKKQNLIDLKELQGKMGWKLLLNEHTHIARGNDKIALVGVENWGKGRFKKAGDLNKAVTGLDDSEFKILMSHDPSHWREEVIPHKKKIQLTLSGHTHGMQFGFEIPGLVKWSPVKYRYKEWAGIYKEGADFLNVNRGFGYIGYPGRVGIWPEISVITLKKGSSSV
ncbi:MAG: metallophosphoesterase [Gilvibacter sp.]